MYGSFQMKICGERGTATASVAMKIRAIGQISTSAENVVARGRVRTQKIRRRMSGLGAVNWPGKPRSKFRRQGLDINITINREPSCRRTRSFHGWPHLRQRLWNHQRKLMCATGHIGGVV